MTKDMYGIDVIMILRAPRWGADDSVITDSRVPIGTLRYRRRSRWDHQQACQRRER